MYTVRQITGADIHKVGSRYIRNCDKGHGIIISKDDTEIGYYIWEHVLWNYGDDDDAVLVANNANMGLFEEHREKGHWETANAKQIIRAVRDWQFNVGGYRKFISYIPTNKLATDYDEGHWESVEDLEAGEQLGHPDLEYKLCTCSVETYKKVYGIE